MSAGGEYHRSDAGFLFLLWSDLTWPYSRLPVEAPLCVISLDFSLQSQLNQAINEVRIG